jgi:hypothetical protein
MESTHEPADPVAKGVFATATQSFHDLFNFKQRVVVTNELGETSTEWARPVPLRNPISLLAQLSGRDWLFFIVGFAAWTADAYDFHALSIQQVKLANYFRTSKTDVSTAITLSELVISPFSCRGSSREQHCSRTTPLTPQTGHYWLTLDDSAAAAVGRGRHVRPRRRPMGTQVAHGKESRLL